MTRPRQRRSLSVEELRLWAHVARQAVPLPGRSMPEAPPEPAPPNPGPEVEPALAAPMPTPVRRAAPLAPLERKLRLGLRRGTTAVDAVIDLHGMRQEEAHSALRRFLARAQSAGHGVVLVITGKGGAGGDDAVFAERGVLKRVVPHWLRLPDLRGHVLGFEEASPRHGGAGALYVRLRHSRGVRRS